MLPPRCGPVQRWLPTKLLPRQWLSDLSPARAFLLCSSLGPAPEHCRSGGRSWPAGSELCPSLLLCRREVSPRCVYAMQAGTLLVLALVIVIVILVVALVRGGRPRHHH